MPEKDIQTILDKLDEVETEVSEIHTCLAGYNGNEGLINRVASHGKSIKYLTIALVVITCAILGIDKIGGV